MYKNRIKNRKEAAISNLSFLSRRMSIILILCVIIILALSILYLHFEWRKYEDIASSEAIQLGESLESLIYPDSISALDGDSEDINKPEYILAKSSLIQLVQTTNSLHFAYLMMEKNGKVMFLVDSESPESVNYSPPGQIYEEADRWTYEAFQTGKTIITPAGSDRWGTWISVLVPVKASDSGEIVAVFGIDFSAKEWTLALWKQMISSFIIVFVVIILLFLFFRILMQHFRLASLNKQLAIDKALYRSIFDQAPIGIAVMDNAAHALTTGLGDMTINPVYEKILGRSKEELQKMTWAEMTHNNDLKEDLEKYKQFQKGEISGYSMEKRFLKPDGSAIWTNMKISAINGLGENNSLYLSLIEDISERKQAEEALKESERRESVLLSHLPGLAYRCKFDRDGTMLIVSEGCTTLTGYKPEAFINNKELPFNDIITTEYRDILWAEWERTIPNKLPYKCEYEITTADGQKKWVLEIGQGIYDAQGEVEALEGIILDISDRKQIENNLQHMIEHDGWTGLFNREYLEMYLQKEIAKNDGSNKALISINLSTVQLLTANYGFHYTQNLIKKAAESLRHFCRPNRVLFKTYENRFVFYVSGYKNKNELLNFCETIAGTLEAIFLAERIGGGIGILEINSKHKNVNVDQILKRLLIASERSMNIFDKDFKACFYDKELEALVNREGEIRKVLSSIAVDNSNNELYLHFQPIINAKTEAVCAFEALARLRTQELGQVSPAEFIPIAEKTKLIVPLGDKIIYGALQFLKKLNELGYQSIGVSINISAIQLLRPDFISKLFGVIKEMKVDPRNIGIELTESIFASDYELINGIIGQLRTAGIQISIDDFGTGYSSLAREKELNVNCLKIDKYFIDKLLEVDINKAITGDIISMAHKLGHCAVAEGVEYERQLRYLKEYGCDKIQGYLISKPLDEDKAIEFINKYGKVADCRVNDSLRI